MRLMITADLRNRGDASTRGNAINLLTQDSIIDRTRRCRRRIDEAANLHADRKRKRSFRYRTSGLLSSIVGADRLFLRTKGGHFGRNTAICMYKALSVQATLSIMYKQSGRVDASK